MKCKYCGCPAHCGMSCTECYNCPDCACTECDYEEPTTQSTNADVRD